MKANGLLSNYPVVISVPVHWGEQDALGHVNNISYLRWAETARVDYLIRIGAWQGLEKDGIGPILANISCDYKRPVTYPDTVLVGARVERIGNTSMRMLHRIVSITGGDVTAEVSSVLVIYDYKTGKPVRVSDEIRVAVARIEAAGPATVLGTGCAGAE